MRLDVPTLTTDRLVIRPFAVEDRDAVAQLLDRIWLAEGEAPPPPDLEREQAHARWLEWTILSYEQHARLYQPPYGDRAITLRASGELIGAVGYSPCLHPFGQVGLSSAPPMGHSPELGLFWALAPQQRGHGYAGEAARALIDFAFEEMQLYRIVATTDYANLASQRVMEKLGMRLLRNPLPGPPWLEVVGVLVNEGPAG
jgi:ribosomal-protein-alanine N-acetyltransferase